MSQVYFLAHSRQLQAPRTRLSILTLSVFVPFRIPELVRSVSVPSSQISSFLLFIIHDMLAATDL